MSEKEFLDFLKEDIRTPWRFDYIDTVKELICKIQLTKKDCDNWHNTKLPLKRRIQWFFHKLTHPKIWYYQIYDYLFKKFKPWIWKANQLILANEARKLTEQVDRFIAFGDTIKKGGIDKNE